MAIICPLQQRAKSSKYRCLTNKNMWVFPLLLAASTLISSFKLSKFYLKKLKDWCTYIVFIHQQVRCLERPPYGQRP